ncbi:hypothetical protein AX17_002704 [Amanita inopinata Kibby_2008]|nr:hypothetical protein AX17_002704 [Amanita inopinata Kibby_2008]
MSCCRSSMSSSPSPVSPCEYARSTHPLKAIMFSIRQALTPSSQKRRRDTSNKRNTPNEDDSYVTPSPYRQDHTTKSPPSVEQIAMGLHVSRTPHLRPLSSPQPYVHPSPKHSVRHATHSASPSTSRLTTSSSAHYPPPPSRSSLKKSSTVASSSTMSHSAIPDFSATSASSTTITSNTLTTPRSGRSLSSLKLCMPRLLSGSRSRSSASPMPMSTAYSPYETPKHAPPKKAVRFTGQVSSQDEDD